MSNVAPIVGFIGNGRLMLIKVRIISAHERVLKNDDDWVNASLDLALALREAKALVPSDMTFSGWLTTNQCSFYNKDQQGSLIGMAAQPELMRVVLSEAKVRSYEVIWREHRQRFKPPRKPKEKRTYHKRKDTYNKMGSRMTFRALKLGDDVMAKIKGTSLDSAPEMDELITLNRGARLGQLTELVKRLVAEAAAGKDVSAIAESNKLPNGVRVKQTLIPAWRKRMVSIWETANEGDQVSLLLYLVLHSKWKDQEELLTKLLELHHAQQQPKEAT